MEYLRYTQTLLMKISLAAEFEALPLDTLKTIALHEYYTCYRQHKATKHAQRHEAALRAASECAGSETYPPDTIEEWLVEQRMVPTRVCTASRCCTWNVVKSRGVIQNLGMKM